MREGRNRPGKAKLRAEEIGLQVRVRALVRSGSVAVLGGDSKWTQNFGGRGNFPTVEVEMLRVRGRGAALERAKRRGLQKGDRSMRKGIAAVKLDLLGV